MYWIKEERFEEHSGLLRKALYTIFVAGLLMGFVLEAIDFKDWKFLLQLAGLVVFVDLAIYQTPHIVKIWSAEFREGDKIVKTLKQNVKTIQFMRKKASVFSILLQSGEELFASKPSSFDFDHYRQGLLQTLVQYTNEFGIEANIYQIEGMENEEELQGCILNVLHRIENLYNVDMPDKKNVAMDLQQAQVCSLEEDRYAIIPIYGTRFNILIVLSAKAEPIMEIDTQHVISLTTIYNWQA
ncbi:type II toxin-antitoxin system SpoIISA family toxin [Fictibacillus sp. Mic-4]|uniref:type II toxin-antitoxin system SpoIISA family toxin n=1 Tax=Fictibacillus sp. Mic-4 TaxID=3132826 RepID=UPI003CEAE46D